MPSPRKLWKYILLDESSRFVSTVCFSCLNQEIPEGFVTVLGLVLYLFLWPQCTLFWLFHHFNSPGNEIL